MAGLPWFKQAVDLRRDPRSLILGDILGDPRAWTYVVEMRMYFAEHAPTGCVSGLHADIAFERGSGWTGERGRLLNALRDAGFVRACPARDGEGTQIEDLDWSREQGAHVAKFQRDAKKPAGRSYNVVSPSRETEGNRAGPSETPRGESRELRVENTSSLKKGTASPSPNSFELTSPASNKQRKQREPSAAEALFQKIQESREARCVEVGETVVPERWDFARQNKVLGEVLREDPERRSLFERAWARYLENEAEKERLPAWSLSFFMSSGVRAKYETMAAREEAA